MADESDLSHRGISLIHREEKISLPEIQLFSHCHGSSDRRVRVDRHILQLSDHVATVADNFLYGLPAIVRCCPGKLFQRQS